MTTQQQHEYIILGAGPAGLQLAYYLQKNKRDYLVLEQGNAVGHTFHNHPKHGQLISINKVHTGFAKDNPINLRWDWHSLLTDDYSSRFTDLTRDYFPNKQFFLDYLKQFTQQFQLNIQTNCHVNNISRDEHGFILKTNNEQIHCKHLIIATGVAKGYLPNIKGIEFATHYNDISLDKSHFDNKRVLIIGKGNSGFETADYLIDSAAVIHLASPSPLRFAWRTHYVGHVRAVNNNFLDTYQLKSQNGVINAEIKSIKKEGEQYRVAFEYIHANGEKEEILYDHVIACTGFQFDTSIFDANCQPETTIMGRFPKMSNHYESTNIPNCYFAGTLTQSLDYKKKQSGFVHGFRYNVAFLAKYLESKNHHKSLISHTYPLSMNVICDAILNRINHSSALWQQTGYLCDAITFDLSTLAANYYESLPTDFVKENLCDQEKYTLIITLDFGQARVDTFPDVFTIPRVHKQDHQNAHLSTFIHPILTLFKGDKIISKHHILEDFESTWVEEEHIKPLKHYLCGMISTITTLSQKELIE